MNVFIVWLFCSKDMLFFKIWRLIEFFTLQLKRTNVKKPGSERTGHGLRVKFNPLALLLDASLEGEFDLVQRIIYEVQFSCHTLLTLTLYAWTGLSRSLSPQLVSILRWTILVLQMMKVSRLSIMQYVQVTTILWNSCWTLGSMSTQQIVMDGEDYHFCLMFISWLLSALGNNTKSYLSSDVCSC